MAIQRLQAGQVCKATLDSLRMGLKWVLNEGQPWLQALGYPLNLCARTSRLELVPADYESRELACSSTYPSYVYI